jgi:hypothetical protein
MRCRRCRISIWEANALSRGIIVLVNAKLFFEADRAVAAETLGNQAVAATVAAPWFGGRWAVSLEPTLKNQAEVGLMATS